MNLIEQLGGYEKAKGYLENLQKIPSHEQTEDTIVWLPSALLEYRRQHKIFEVGDKVVSTAGLIRTVFKITDITDEFMRADYLELRHGVWRHATDAEIEAGKRSEVV